ncbi:glycosyltransferase [Kitasatospora sp. NPDC048194]|uniref:glycosyltransferase n=1 Tax=Kitasatospora sp. NPDC048194 TaxID=3364045 RepID=UPI00371F8E48
MRSLRISLVSEHASPLAVLGGVDAGGQNVHVAALAAGLARRGHRVTVHTRRDDPDLDPLVPFGPGVVVHHVPAGPPRPLPKDQLLPYMPAFGDRLGEHWGAERPDVVHSHFWMSGLASLLGASVCDGSAGAGPPVVHTYHALGTVKRRHQGAADTSPPGRIAIETAVGLGAARIVATCRDEVGELQAMGVDPERSRIVPCGVDTRRFSPDGPVAERSGRPRLLQIGRLVPRKGADTAIRALAALPGAELLLAGGPPAWELPHDPEAGRLRDLARALGLGERVRLLGGVAPSDMPALIRSADLVLCPARYEPFGIVPLEAMACGVPVVATAVGGQLDTVLDHRTGRLVAPDRPAELAEACAHLLARPGLRAAYGRAGRKRALDHFGWDRIAAATELVYRELLDRSRSERSVHPVEGALR